MNIAWRRKVLSQDGYRAREWWDGKDYRRNGFDCLHAPGQGRELLTPLMRRSYRLDGRPRSKVMYRPAMGIRTCCLADAADPMPRIGFWWTFEERLSAAPGWVFPLKDWMSDEIGERVPILTAAEILLGSLWFIDGEGFLSRPSRAEMRREHLARAQARVDAYLKTRRPAETPDSWKTRTYPSPSPTYSYVNFGGRGAPHAPAPSPSPIEADYRLLGLTWPFSAEEAKKAYRAAVMSRHPDKGGTPAAFMEVQQAYERLAAIVGASEHTWPGHR